MPNEIHAVWKDQPTDPICDKMIEVTVVAERCIYLNDHRIVGGKPYVSENLPQRSMDLTIREALEAFSIKELEAYVKEVAARQKYFADYRASQAQGGGANG